jgi:hypothetical protein
MISSRTIDTHVSRVRTKLWLTEENGWLCLPYMHAATGSSDWKRDLGAFGSRIETMG